VIIRPTNYAWIRPIDNYLDSKMIGRTSGKSYFVTLAAPGTHYLFARAKATAATKVNLEAGRVYFIAEPQPPGEWGVRGGLGLMTLEKARQEMEECEARAYDPSHPGPDLEAQDQNEAKEAYEKAVAAGQHPEVDLPSYRGYDAL
jgi:hypothetical protein